MRKQEIAVVIFLMLVMAMAGHFYCLNHGGETAVLFFAITSLMATVLSVALALTVWHDRCKRLWWRLEKSIATQTRLFWVVPALGVAISLVSIVAGVHAVVAGNILVATIATATLFVGTATWGSSARMQFIRQLRRTRIRLLPAPEEETS